jgi:predicted transcriptional regulator
MLIRSSEFDDFINSLIYELIYEHKIKFPKIVTLFLLIKEKGPVGRYKIVKELELPESITRGTLSYFKNLGIIHVTKKGAILTDTGTDILSRIFEKTRIKSIKAFNFEFMALDSCCAVAQLPHRKINILTLRDKAIRAGASACMIISYERGRLIVPKVYGDLSTLFPPLAGKLIKEFSFVDGDLLISAFAPRAWKAKEAVISAAIDDYAYQTYDAMMLR